MSQDVEIKELFVYAIKGRGCGGPYLWGNKIMEARGLIKFTGDQHNPDWTWQTEELAKLDIQELHSIYLKVR